MVVAVFNLSSERGTLFFNNYLSSLFIVFFLRGFPSKVFNFFSLSLLCFVLNCQQYLTKTTIIIKNTIMLAIRPNIVHMLLKILSADAWSHVSCYVLNFLSLLQLQVLLSIISLASQIFEQFIWQIKESDTQS